MKKLIIVSLLSVFALGTFGQTAAIHQILDKMSEEGLFFTNEIRSLLEKGIDTKGKYGRSPLNVAAMYHCTDLGKADNDGRTPLHHAACCRNVWNYYWRRGQSNRNLETRYRYRYAPDIRKNNWNLILNSR